MSPGPAGGSGVDLGSALGSLIRDVPDFPQPGIVFKDITPLLADHAAFSATIDALAERGRDATGAVVVDKVIGMEARGFILAAPVALALGAGFVPVRKAGKLPRDAHVVSYALEYGEATLQVHADAFDEGDRVVIVDDVLATGGTAAARIDLVRRAGAEVVGISVLIELEFLHGRAALEGVGVHALLFA